MFAPLNGWFVGSENFTVIVSPLSKLATGVSFGSSATIPVIKGIVIGVETPVSVIVEVETSVVKDDAAD